MGCGRMKQEERTYKHMDKCKKGRRIERARLFSLETKATYPITSHSIMRLVISIHYGNLTYVLMFET